MYLKHVFPIFSLNVQLLKKSPLVNRPSIFDFDIYLKNPNQKNQLKISKCRLEKEELETKTLKTKVMKLT